MSCLPFIKPKRLSSSLLMMMMMALILLELHHAKSFLSSSWSLFATATTTTTTQECGVYLAPSTIPGAGFGMFAGSKEYQKGDILTDGDLMVPVMEMDWHNRQNQYPFLWEEYFWNARKFPGMEFEVAQYDNSIFAVSGAMAAANCMMNLINAKDERESYAVGTSGVNSGESPGAGAFTPYHGRKFMAKKRIEPGAELYINYGQAYFIERKVYKHVPLKEHFRTATTITTKFQEVSNKVFLRTGHRDGYGSDNNQWNVSDAVKSSLWELVRDVVRTAKQKNHWRRLLNALPTNASHLDALMQVGGVMMAHYNESIRSLDWLEEHGQCMDNIKDGVSTIRDAGRGAFANRFIPKGGLVAPAPLIQIPYRKVFDMYDSAENEEGKEKRGVPKPSHQQLLLNYCFGHRDTTLLLCPYGLLTALINHGHGDKANTKIQWSQSMRHPEWRNQTIKSFKKEKHTGLSFDFVAIRDIEEDEEILIDYGDEWEIAWEEHTKLFHPQRRGYVPAFELNNQVDLQIKTMEEYDYGFEGVHMYCWNLYLELGGHKPRRDDEDIDYSPCRVFIRNHNDSYVAELWDVELNEDQRVIRHDVVGILLDVPRDAFHFVDAPYTRDIHQTWSFRHDMRIPDEIFPESWKHGKTATRMPVTNENKPGAKRKARHIPEGDL